MAFTTLIKHLIQMNLRRIGYEIKRLENGEMSVLVRELNSRQVETIYDVGANLGQYALSCFAAGFEGMIISFEPQADIHSRISKSAASNPNWEVYRRCAVGRKSGTATINRAANSVSTSLLPIETTHTLAAPNSRTVGVETVDVLSLHDIIQTPAEQSFLKIDTQGFEGEVLHGASDLLTKISGVQLEISIAPLYLGQATYQELFGKLHEAKLKLWSVEPGFRNPQTGQLLQFDAIFLR